MEALGINDIEEIVIIHKTTNSSPLTMLSRVLILLISFLLVWFFQMLIRPPRDVNNSQFINICTINSCKQRIWNCNFIFCFEIFGEVQNGTFIYSGQHFLALLLHHRRSGNSFVSNQNRIFIIVRREVFRKGAALWVAYYPSDENFFELFFELMIVSSLALNTS